MTVPADATGREAANTLVKLSLFLFLSRGPLVHPRSEPEELLVGLVCGMNAVGLELDG